ncbi:lysylphosphatidylglycerol synthase transmembrane domain-containing protein [uncultured Marinobacter sp.]|uniref:lysylphosphatidylglycerol synthase transmembrane domain-containing protein n=1 Tax=uncultured Marinobacter sp. TaxID=187379 RepID=UPI0030D89B77
MTAASPGAVPWKTAIRWLATVLILVLVAWWIDFASIGQRLAELHPGWVLLALLVTPMQVALSAWRWQYTVRCLGGQLPLGAAVREYYLATFINQVLPGGVVGDAGRAWRQGLWAGDWQRAIHGVMLERLSGQLVLLLVGGGLLLMYLPGMAEGFPASSGLVSGLLVLALGLILLVRWVPALRRWFGQLLADASQALLGWQATPVQLGSSLLVLGSYLLVFWLLALAQGSVTATASPGLLLALCSVLLLTMVIPLTVAGWGIREGAAAILWPLAGLPAEEGVALAVAYGLLVLVSALPGALWLLSAPGSSDQTTYPIPD